MIHMWFDEITKLPSLMYTPMESLDHVGSFEIMRQRVLPNGKLTVHLAEPVVGPVYSYTHHFLCLIFQKKVEEMEICQVTGRVCDMSYEDYTTFLTLFVTCFQDLTTSIYFELGSYLIKNLFSLFKKMKIYYLLK